jgi:hypothetical protein
MLLVANPPAGSVASSCHDRQLFLTLPGDVVAGNRPACPRIELRTGCFHFDCLRTLCLCHCSS